MVRIVFSFLFLSLLFFASCKQEKSSSNTTPVTTASAKFVGDEACQSCHEDIYASYHRTGMGKSVSAFDPKTAVEQFGGAPIFDAKNKLYYEAFVKNDSLFQREYRKSANGAIEHERIEKADVVVGSGNATRSYMMNSNGFYTEMPLTWYVQRKKWDLSPGYHQNNQRFDRPINNECMTCHNGFAQHSEGTQNHFTNVPLGISCERCHGAGGAHIEARLESDLEEGKADPTIVNPKRLSRNAQLSVCQQCHIDGTMVFTEGNTPQTFFSGMLLTTHRTVFAEEDKIRDPEHFGIASHGTRLAQSKCYQLSEMTCTTCHNPHKPVAELGADYFNQQCLSCHGKSANQAVCERPEAQGKPDKTMAMSGNCISCHIQKSGTSDIPHVTFTDHWIRRTLPAVKGASSPEAIEALVSKRTTTAKMVRVLDIESGKMQVNALETEPQNALAKLEAAVAYFHYYEVKHQNPAYLPIVIRYATEGFGAGANLNEARVVWGRALHEQGNFAEAISQLKKATEENPQSAFAFYWLGLAHEQNQDTASAMNAYQQASNLQPRFLEAKSKIADLMMQQGQTTSAKLLLEDIIRQNPRGNAGVWNNLGMMYLQSQDAQNAENVLRKSIALNPDKPEALVNLATSLLMQQRLDEAQPFLERALSKDAQNVAAIGNLGFIYMNKGNKAKAKQMFQKLLSINPNDERARAFLTQL